MPTPLLNQDRRGTPSPVLIPSLSNAIASIAAEPCQPPCHANHYPHDDGRRWAVRLVESHDVIPNPGVGFCTYQRFNGDPTEKENYWNDDGPTEYRDDPADLTNQNHPATTLAYLRWYWARIEPEEGGYRWDIIDRALATAKRRGQQLHIRVMPHDSTTLVPEWYQGTIHESQGSGGLVLTPDYNDPYFQKRTERLVAELGRRYDGHPDLYAVDIGTLGHWGEWHCCMAKHPNKMMDAAGRRWAVDLYFQAFKKTPMLGLIGAPDALGYAVEQGAGWRADCWGDDRSGSWHHMSSCYPWNLTQARASHAWKRGPVCMETCWTIKHWHDQGWDIDYIFEEAVRWHASTINAKSGIIPLPLGDKVQKLLTRLGYRHVLRQVDYPMRIQPGQKAEIRQWWVNVGNAPVYVPCRVRLTLTHRSSSWSWSVEQAEDLRSWLPGDDQCVTGQVTLPSDSPMGDCELSVSIVRQGESEPFIRPANVEADHSGKVVIGTVRVMRSI